MFKDSFCQVQCIEVAPHCIPQAGMATCDSEHEDEDGCVLTKTKGPSAMRGEQNCLPLRRVL